MKEAVGLIVLIPLRTGKGSNAKALKAKDIDQVLIPLRTGKGSNFEEMFADKEAAVLIPL